MACGVLVDRSALAWATLPEWKSRASCLKAISVSSCEGNRSWSHSSPVTSAEPSLSLSLWSEVSFAPPPCIDGFAPLPSSPQSPCLSDSLPDPDPDLPAGPTAPDAIKVSKCAIAVGDSTSKVDFSAAYSRKMRSKSGDAPSMSGSSSMACCPSGPMTLMVGEGLYCGKGWGEGDWICKTG